MSSAVHVIEHTDRAAALLTPLRLRLLEALREPDSASGLARRFELPRQQLNYHLRQLEDEGLVEVVGERQRRGFTERILQAVAHGFVLSPATLGPLAARPEHVADVASSEYLVAVAARTIDEITALRAQADVRGRRLPTLTLDTEVRFASGAQQRAFADELARDVARLVAKYHDDAAPNGRRFRVVVGAHPKRSA